MKLLTFVSLLFLVGCATRPAPPVAPSVQATVPGTILPAEGLEAIRYAENLKAYNIGRYVDPSNTRMMHEADIVYRIETTAKWNLHPNAPGLMTTGPIVRIVDPARQEIPMNEEVVAEVNKQKAATQALLDQGSRLNETLQQLSGAAESTKRLAEQNAQFKQELSAAKQRLEALEEELRKKPSAAKNPKPKPVEGW